MELIRMWPIWLRRPSLEKIEMHKVPGGYLVITEGGEPVITEGGEEVMANE